MSRHDEGSGDVPGYTPVQAMNAMSGTTAHRIARLAALDAERAQLVAELREDFASLKAALPRQRTVKPKADKPKAGRPKGSKNARKVAADVSPVEG